MSRIVRVGITHGDMNGIGYEVILKAIGAEGMTEICTPVVFGFHSVAEKCRKQLGMDELRLFRVPSAEAAQDGRVNVVDVASNVPELTPGVITPEAGEAAVAALEAAVEALKEGNIDVLVTAPICKENVQSDAFHFPGHTEYLEEKIGEGAKARMILFDDLLRVALVTTHLPIAKVAESITAESVGEAIDSLDQSLKRDFGIVRPRIAVLSLNPHAGDGGLLGTEEKEIIEPVIMGAREKGVLAFGPFPTDGFFAQGDYRKFDGIVAMYHDQGLAPFKTIAGEHGVNFTAGLPFIRTSPDHGTAFGIAWKGEADPTSMREAIYKAIDLYRRRSIFDEASANPLRKFVSDKPDKGERHDRAPKKEPKQQEQTSSEQ
ncbi:MAG: 4-hydroxythreonine-4-phosphate dehydrogenase PdxA [Bacteroides sp.]|nr:4-hydroxythreonine-4-phosphate dehydrogenase PdxA [Bacteroides sp.]